MALINNNCTVFLSLQEIIIEDQNLAGMSRMLTQLLRQMRNTSLKHSVIHPFINHHNLTRLRALKH